MIWDSVSSELDLLFRKFTNNHLESMGEDDFIMFNSILDLEDQRIYDFIFKNTSLNNKAQEDFILQRIKKFLD